MLVSHTASLLHAILVTAYFLITFVPTHLLARVTHTPLAITLLLAQVAKLPQWTGGQKEATTTWYERRDLYRYTVGIVHLHGSGLVL